MDSVLSLKTPKGTRDYPAADALVVADIVAEAEGVYKKYGGLPLDTPTFELRAVLTNKYGDNAKLIFDLADQGGEACSLRYDLTVPLARYLALTKTVKMKRYQTGKVFRRDQPVLSKGRYREFWQSDFDIVGDFEPMTADAEVVSAACEILRIFSAKMGQRPFRLRLNHRGLVDGLMQAADVPEDLWKTVGSSIDKLDKLPWEAVRKEILEKGAEEDSAEVIRELTSIRGPLAAIYKLKEGPIGRTGSAQAALADLEKLYSLLIVHGVEEMVEIDLSLIRGLDYYTGILIEGEFEGGDGSIIAGGRYDGLVRSLLAGKSSAPEEQDAASNVRCVGISLGVSRLFSMMPVPGRRSFADAFVCSVGPDMLESRLRICAYLRKSGVNAEYFMGSASHFSKHSDYAEALGIKTLVLIGRKELESNECQVIQGERQARVKHTVAIPDLPAFILRNRPAEAADHHE